MNEEDYFTDNDILDTAINGAFNLSLRKQMIQNEFFAKSRVIRNNNCCEFNGKFPKISYVRDTSALDGYRWRFKRPCTFSISIKSNSFFETSDYEFRNVFDDLYKYTLGGIFTVIALELNREVD